MTPFAYYAPTQKLTVVIDFWLRSTYTALKLILLELYSQPGLDLHQLTTAYIPAIPKCCKLDYSTRFKGFHQKTRVGTLIG